MVWAGLLACTGRLDAADLAVSGVTLAPGSTASVVVSGAIVAELASSIEVVLQIVPQADAVGTVTFTPAVTAGDVDIAQFPLPQADPWAGAGNFIPLDTNMSFSDVLNGATLDNGDVPVLVTFSGNLFSFPIVASANAVGTWDIRLDNITALPSGWFGNGLDPIPGNITNGTITVSQSLCNSNAECNDNDPCTDNICIDFACTFPTNTDPCDDGDACTTNDTCSGGVCVGGAAPNCDDADACTDDACDSLTGCVHPANTDPCDDGNACTTADTCDGAGTCVGGAAPNCSDGNDCTDDSCDPAFGCVHTNNTAACDDDLFCTVNDACSGSSCSGVPRDCTAASDQCNIGVCNETTDACEPQPVADSTSCDDGDVCTEPDLCSGGGCVGAMIQGCQPCTDALACDDSEICTDDLCVGGTCQNPANGVCPTLSLRSDQVCYGGLGNNTVVVSVDMLGMTGLGGPIVGGQFFIDYDPTRLDFIQMDPGDAPFTFELAELVDETNGTIEYAVVPGLGVGGTNADTTMARITFQTIAACTPFVRFDTLHAPPNSVTVLGSPAPVLPFLENMAPISIDVTAPVLTCPNDISLHADAGTCSAVVNWVEPTATDNCDGPLPVTCTSFPVMGLGNGDTFASGQPTQITCQATDSCGNMSQCSFTVTVSNFNEVFVDVEFEGVDPSVFTRCVTFGLSNCGTGQPVEFVPRQIAITNGAATGVSVLVPCGAYDCMTARDTLHTLRSTAQDFSDDGKTYSATFTGDPSAGGDWLTGGNLNDDLFVDIVDFGVFALQFNTFVGASTDCFTPFPHSDINGDGMVGAADFTFFQQNFSVGSDPDCCEASPLQFSDPSREPIMRISVRELVTMGLSDLVRSDLNNDGWLDVQDVAAFLNGARGDDRDGDRIHRPIGVPGSIKRTRHPR